MKSYELLRAAATLILEGGWATGQDATGQAVDAADAEGNPIPLYVTGSTDTGRAAPNPAAVKFSAYGAIVTALHQNGGRLEDPAAMWTLLAKRASEINNVAHGGYNLVHPLHQLNATEGMEAVKILVFLGKCADEMEGVAQAVAMLKNEPFEVRAIPRLTEPAPFTLQTPMTNFDRVALGPHPSQPPATLREVFDVVLAPNAMPLPPALTTKDVKDLHTTLAVPGEQTHTMTTADIHAMHSNPVPLKLAELPPYKPMLTTRTLREEHPPALYSGPELNVTRVGPNPFGGDDEV